MKLRDIEPAPNVITLELTQHEAQELYDAISRMAESSLRGTCLIDIGLALRDRGFRRSPGIIPAEGMEKMK